MFEGGDVVVSEDVGEGLLLLLGVFSVVEPWFAVLRGRPEAWFSNTKLMTHAPQCKTCVSDPVDVTVATRRSSSYLSLTTWHTSGKFIFKQQQLPIFRKGKYVP